MAYQKLFNCTSY